MKLVHVRITAEQAASLKLLSDPNTDLKQSQHFRRALDMYLSQPAIMEALVELEKKVTRNQEGV